MSLFVGSIYVNIKKTDIVNAFRKFGPCKVDLKKKYAFVEFETVEQADRALHALHGSNLGGLNAHYKLNIEWSKNSDRIADYEKERLEREQKGIKAEVKVKTKNGDSEKPAEELKEPISQMQDKPKELVLMTLLQQAIKERCGSGSEICYERPIEVFPTGDIQEINLEGDKRMDDTKGEQKIKRPEECMDMNSIELKKVMAEKGMKIPDMATREQLIDLILSQP